METLPPVKPTKNSSCTKKNHSKNKLKVVYISSPMKVKTSVSKFRALVQELTGRDSDISRYDDIVGNYFDPVVAPVVTTITGAKGGLVDRKVVESSCGEQGMHFSGLESLLDDDDVFGVNLDQFEGMMFPSYSLHESCFQ